MTAAPGRCADPYVPGHGDLSFGVDHYDLDLRYRLASNRLTGHAELTCRSLADEPLDEFELDLAGLVVEKVKVDGSTPRRYRQTGTRLAVRPGSPVAPGETFTVAVSYSGKPVPLRGADGEVGWEELTDGVIVASQPEGAPSWFPCNDRPSDKASYRVSFTTAPSHTVVVNGRLVSRKSSASGSTWTYDQPEPMATYLATVQVGRYVVRGLAESPVAVSATYPPAREGEVLRALERQGEMVEVFCRLFGPYPFASGYSVVVTDDELEIPLEAQGLSIFGHNLCRTDWDAQRLVAHELAHQWFGNSLTLGAWRDIWLHEGFACYAEWLWSEESGGTSADDHARSHHERLATLPQDLLLGDPGRENMFDDRVYKRGALTLHALRLEAGDDAFFALLREWADRFRHSSVSRADFESLAVELCGDAASGVLAAWLDELPLPALAQRP